MSKKQNQNTQNSDTEGKPKKTSEYTDLATLIKLEKSSLNRCGKTNIDPDRSSTVARSKSNKKQAEFFSRAGSVAQAELVSPAESAIQSGSVNRAKSASHGKSVSRAESFSLVKSSSRKKSVSKAESSSLLNPVSRVDEKIGNNVDAIRFIYNI